MITPVENFLSSYKRGKQAFLTGYFVGGDPNEETALSYIKEAVESGIDAIEVGIPSKNPYLEGDVIKRSHSRVYPDFKETKKIISFFQKLRSEIHVPILAMGYYEDVIQSGLYRELIKNQLIDGFVIPDLPLEKLKIIRQELSKYNILLVPVINNGMEEEQLTIALTGANLVYCQIYQGKTGSEIDNIEELPSFYSRISSQTDAVLMAGFGVKNAKFARQVWDCGFEGVVVGSEIVRLVEMQDRKKLSNFIHDLSKAKNREGV